MSAQWSGPRGKAGPPPSRIITPAAGDPDRPTLHTCGDCGFQLLIPMGIVPLAVQTHGPRCLGPRVNHLLTILDPTWGQDHTTTPEVTS